MVEATGHRNAKQILIAINIHKTQTDHFRHTNEIDNVETRFDTASCS